MKHFLIILIIFATSPVLSFAADSSLINGQQINGSYINGAEEHSSIKEIEIQEEDENKQDSYDLSRSSYTIEELIEIIDYLKRQISFLKWQKEGIGMQRNINSASYLVVDMTNEKVLLSKNPTVRYPIASITKLMSALAVKESHEIDQEIVLSSNMLSTLYNKTPALFPNLSISITSLISASLIGSINDAAESLNYVVERDLIEMMNEKTKTISMHNTAFADAHGISSQNISTAQDLAKLMYYLRIQHPDILEITRKSDFWLTDQNNNPVLFRNLNLFHGSSDFVGGKTGFTNAAQLTFSGIFNYDDTEYIVVLLYTKNRASDTKQIIEWLQKRPL